MKRKVNKIAKGRRLEKHIADILARNKFYVWRPTWNRWQSKDIFNLADIIAIPKQYHMADILLIQVKSHISDFYKARKKMREFAKQNKHLNHIQFIVVAKIDKNTYRYWWRIGEMENEGTTINHDWWL